MKEIPVKCSGISVVLLKKVGDSMRVLLLKRSSAIFNQAWCYIGGGIEEEETAIDTALREIKEETGLVPVRLYTSNKFEEFYNPKENYIYKSPVFVGFIRETDEVRLNEEHCDYHWFSVSEAINKVTIPGADEILSFIDKHFIMKQPLEYLVVFER